MEVKMHILYRIIFLQNSSAFYRNLFNYINFDNLKLILRLIFKFNDIASFLQI